MDAAVPDAIVGGYEALIEGLTLPDADDRHVLAAAIVANVDIIVTLNLKDFPPDHLMPYGIDVQHPDAFLTQLYDLDEGHFLQSVRRCRQRLKNPEKTADAYIEGLSKAGLVGLAAELERVKILI